MSKATATAVNRVWPTAQMHKIIKSFLTREEMAELGLIIDLKFMKWMPGRQDGGYFNLPLRGFLPRPLMPLLKRTLGELGHDGSDNWDMYLIKYPTGSFIPSHVDPVAEGKRHRRLNAVVRHASMGGGLAIDGQSVELDVSDAVVFFPDQQLHQVDKILAGERVMFSVGVLSDNL